MREEGKGDRSGRERKSNTAGRKNEFEKTCRYVEGGGDSRKVHSYCKKNNVLEEKCVESSCITALPPPHSEYCKCEEKKNIEKYWNIEQGNDNEWVGWSRAGK